LRETLFHSHQWNVQGEGAKGEVLTAFLHAMNEEIARTKRHMRREYASLPMSMSEWISYCILQGTDEPDQEDLDWYKTHKDVTPLGKTE
jgi:hypothetical protein